MTTESCNGWANRETWLVNLYFGDTWAEMARDNYDITPESCREDVEQHLYDVLGNATGFVWDMIPLSSVNWHEIAEIHHAAK